MNYSIESTVEYKAEDILKIVSRGLQIPLEPETSEHFYKDICGSLEAGWSRVDIISFLRQTEEFNPELPEDIALSRMADIDKRNKTHFGGHTKSGVQPITTFQ